MRDRDLEPPDGLRRRDEPVVLVVPPQAVLRDASS
jgi:hypothetical protein